MKECDFVWCSWLCCYVTMLFGNGGERSYWLLIGWNKQAGSSGQSERSNGRSFFFSLGLTPNLLMANFFRPMWRPVCQTQVWNQCWTFQSKKLISCFGFSGRQFCICSTNSAAEMSFYSSSIRRHWEEMKLPPCQTASDSQISAWFPAGSQTEKFRGSSECNCSTFKKNKIKKFSLLLCRTTTCCCWQLWMLSRHQRCCC